MNEALRQTIKNIENKEFTFYFFTIDTKNSPLASIEYIYAQASILKENGYNVKILYDTQEKEYTEITWIEDYLNIDHVSVKQEGLKINTSDIVVIPELFTSVMDSLKTIPCHKIILAQNWSNILEFLGRENPEDNTRIFNTSWQDTFKITNVITTSNEQKSYIDDMFYGSKVKIVEPYIDERFISKIKHKKPFIAINGRYSNHVTKVIKAFYLKYPNYKWITFKNLNGLNKTDFIKELDDCCLSVWLDRESSFGTFPLESMKLNIPVIGIIPDMIPEWMIDDNEIKNNGLWLSSLNKVHSTIGNYISSWLENELPEQLFIDMKKTVDNKYLFDTFEKNTLKTYNEFINLRLKELKIYEEK